MLTITAVQSEETVPVMSRAVRSPRLLHWLWLGLVTVAFCSACSGSDGGTPAGTPVEAGIDGPDAAVEEASTESPETSDPFDGSHAESLYNIVLGRPTDHSIAVSVLAAQGDSLYLEYGTSAGVYPNNTEETTATAGEPIVVELTGLQENTRYYYRLRYKASGESSFVSDNEHSFHTRRSLGTTFTFGVQGDSHPERPTKMFNADLYNINMRNVASTRPDFYFALGDDFSIERLIEKGLLTQDNVEQVYLSHRTYFGLLGDSTPVFLVNGNHEQAAAYLLSDAWQTPYSQAPIFAGLARLKYYPLPAPDDFYAGDSEEIPGLGLPRDYYAWHWGDALFVTIDPYWHSPNPVDTGVPGITPSKDGWDSTMGDTQYAWLKKTLEESTAKYKFVFAHHVLGTGRGAAGIVHQYEWGGYNQKGTASEFASRRPTWPKPVHQLMVDNKVTIFFYGHDHAFAREKVDGLVYQSVQNPADNTYTAFNADAFDPDTIALPGASYDPDYGVVLPDSGFLHVTVSPQGVTVAYIRAVLPGDEAKAGCANGEVSLTYTVPGG